jgi:NhaP-type Na+/H+ or K+/H+ antiporter
MTLWFLSVGALLILMVLVGSMMQRLPLSTAMIYLLIGFMFGPAGAGLIELDPLREAPLLRLVTEVAVLVSLFTAGLKLRLPLADIAWHLPVRLAVAAMLVTIVLIAFVGIVVLDLSPGVAILLGAILAPTDPVLASDVQIRNPGERDRLRLGLTGEAGLNDGIAFPFVMLGLGLLGLHELGPYGAHWIAVDLIWAVSAGLASGWLWGFGIGSLVVYLRRSYHEALGLEEFLALGLIAFSYGFALLIHSYGFLAVFAAGLALRRMEHGASGDEGPAIVVEPSNPESGKEVATHPEKASAYMTQALLSFSEQLERIVEVAVVLLLGGMLSMRYVTADALWFTPLLFLVIRPMSVALSLRGYETPSQYRKLMGWFGIRGIGSIYYLLYAVERGLPSELAEDLVSLVFDVVAASIVVHGISATPLMDRYSERKERK